MKHIFKDLVAEGQKIVGTIVKIEINSEIPIGSGLGSSAAFGAAISAALLFSVLFAIGEIQFSSSTEIKSFLPERF